MAIKKRFANATLMATKRCAISALTLITQKLNQKLLLFSLTNHTTNWKTNVLLNYQIIKNLPKISKSEKEVFIKTSNFKKEQLLHNSVTCVK